MKIRHVLNGQMRNDEGIHITKYKVSYKLDFCKNYFGT